MEGEEEEERKGSWRGREIGRDSLVIHLGLNQFFFLPTSIQKMFGVKNIKVYLS